MAIGGAASGSTLTTETGPIRTRTFLDRGRLARNEPSDLLMNAPRHLGPPGGRKWRGNFLVRSLTVPTC